MDKDEKLKSKVLVLDSGERVVIVINSRTAIPHLELNRYLFHCRKPVLAFKTLKKEADAICRIFNSGNNLFGDWSGYGLLHKVKGKEIFHFWEELKRSPYKEEVSKDTHMYRWGVFKRIFDYWTDQQILELSHRDPDFRNLVAKKKILLAEISRLKVPSSSRRLSGLDKNVVQELIHISRVDSIENPWIKRDRLRNQIIIDIFIRLGVRAGELLKITLPNVQLRGRFGTITIERLINDKDDPRKNEPRVKTFGRILELDDDLTKNISKYLRERRLIPNAKKTKYLIVSHSTGSPLSSDTLGLIIKSIPLKSYSKRVTPHSLRRTWNDLFREYSEELGFEQEMITQTQNYLQGRMLNSKEAYKYSAKFIEKSAREAHLKFQNALWGENNEK